MKMLLLVLMLSACAAPIPQNLTFEQKMMLYDRMKLTPYQQPYFPVQQRNTEPQHRIVTCTQLTPTMTQCY